MALLIYETDDAGFADAAIEALKKAHINSYRTGGRLSLGPSLPTVCIYIRDAGDLKRANQILIEHGAVVEQPFRLSSGLTARIGIVLGVALLIGIIAWLVNY
jgi:hypothetical protein